MKLRTTAIAAALLAAVAYGAWRVADSRTWQPFGGLVHRVETSEPVVALTFDDGPAAPATDSILAVLRREGVRATFFLTGEEMAARPDLAARLVREGHELGNHSSSHDRMVLRSPAWVRREVEATDSLIRAAGHRGPIHFRPPYGKKLLVLPWYLARTGRTTVTWDVEPDSYAEVAASADRIVEHVLERVRPGSIVILHVMYPSRRESLRSVQGIVRGLRARGYRFETVSGLLSAPPEPGAT